MPVVCKSISIHVLGKKNAILAYQKSFFYYTTTTHKTTIHNPSKPPINLVKQSSTIFTARNSKSPIHKPPTTLNVDPPSSSIALIEREREGEKREVWARVEIFGRRGKNELNKKKKEHCYNDLLLVVYSYSNVQNYLTIFFFK